jgi:hypothetical protein
MLYTDFDMSMKKKSLHFCSKIIIGFYFYSNSTLNLNWLTVKSFFESLSKSIYILFNSEFNEDIDCRYFLKYCETKGSFFTIFAINNSVLNDLIIMGLFVPVVLI